MKLPCIVGSIGAYQQIFAPVPRRHERIIRQWSPEYRQVKCPPALCHGTKTPRLKAIVISCLLYCVSLCNCCASFCGHVESLCSCFEYFVVILSLFVVIQSLSEGVLCLIVVVFHLIEYLFMGAFRVLWLFRAFEVVFCVSLWSF